MLDLISVVIIVVLLLVDYLRKNKSLDYPCDTNESNLPPGNVGLPILGETLQFLRKKGQFFKDKAALYGQIYRTHLFGKPTVRVTGKDNIRKILYGENKLVKSCYPVSVQRLVGPNGLTMSSGLGHDNRKRHLMKFLRHDFVNQHVERLSSFIMGRLEEWCDNKSSINLFLETKTLITELSARFLVSHDIDKSLTEKMVPLYEDFTGNMFTLPINLPGFGFHKAMKAKQDLKMLFKNSLLSNHTSTRKFPSVLEAYGASVTDDTFDEDSFLDAVLELLWNASETTSSSAFCAIYLLSKHPQVVRKIREELIENDIRSDSSDPIDHRQLQSLKYIDVVVKEVLRVLPPIGGAYRQVIEEFSVGGYTIPVNWSVICGIRETQENDTSVKDPLSFNPDRWNEKQDSNIPFYTFGGGNRLCPGQTFAKQILKLFIVELIRNVEWTILNEECDIVFFPTPQPKHQMNARFRKLRAVDSL